jgi:hypothetical protein
MRVRRHILPIVQPATLAPSLGSQERGFAPGPHPGGGRIRSTVTYTERLRYLAVPDCNRPKQHSMLGCLQLPTASACADRPRRDPRQICDSEEPPKQLLWIQRPPCPIRTSGRPGSGSKPIGSKILGSKVRGEGATPSPPANYWPDSVDLMKAATSLWNCLRMSSRT